VQDPAYYPPGICFLLYPLKPHGALAPVAGVSYHMQAVLAQRPILPLT